MIEAKIDGSDGVHRLKDALEAIAMMRSIEANALAEEMRKMAIAALYPNQPTTDRKEAEVDRLRDALAGLVGLIQLVQGRDDVSPNLREALLTNHRYEQALRVLDVSQ